MFIVLLATPNVLFLQYNRTYIGERSLEVIPL
jgi:hypothetical protein